MFPCGVCQQHVCWSHKAVACDYCDVWIHKSCASLNSSYFDKLETDYLSWRCYCCRSINVLSFIYRAYNISTSNSFAPLATIPGEDYVFLHEVASPTGTFTPTHFSSFQERGTRIRAKSPQSSASSSEHSELTNSRTSAVLYNMRIGTLNANSTQGKRAELAELTNSTQVDILIISETKLPSNEELKDPTNACNPSEISPKNFNGTIHRPMSRHGGGVMVLRVGLYLLWQLHPRL